MRCGRPAADAAPLGGPGVGRCAGRRVPTVGACPGRAPVPTIPKCAQVGVAVGAAGRRRPQRGPRRGSGAPGWTEGPGQDGRGFPIAARWSRADVRRGLRMLSRSVAGDHSADLGAVLAGLWSAGLGRGPSVGAAVGGAAGARVRMCVQVSVVVGPVGRLRPERRLRRSSGPAASGRAAVRWLDHGPGSGPGRAAAGSRTDVQPGLRCGGPGRPARDHNAGLSSA